MPETPGQNGAHSANNTMAASGSGGGSTAPAAGAGAGGSTGTSGGATSTGSGNAGATSNGQPLDLAYLNSIVLEYLNKKGYSRTEAMLRMESSRTYNQVPANTSSVNGGPISGQRSAAFSSATSSAHTESSNSHNTPAAMLTKPVVNPAEYRKIYALLTDWVENSLDLYKPELRRISYPIFVHLFLDLVANNHPKAAKAFFETYAKDHEILHGDDTRKMAAVSLPEHLEQNELTKEFRKQKFVVKVSRTTFELLLYFLQEVEDHGGSTIIRIINQYINPLVSASWPSRFDSEYFAEDSSEGLSMAIGVSGSGSGDVAPYNEQPVALGPMPMDDEFKKEVELTLEAQNEKEALEKFKQDHATPEESSGKSGAGSGAVGSEKDGTVDTSGGAKLVSPTRETIPLPQYKAIDVDIEIKKVKDSLAMVKLGRETKSINGTPTTAVQPALPSVCMYTFHNTHDGLNTLSFSDDSTLVSAGFSDSTVKIWSLTGQKLTSVLKSKESPPTVRRLVGHSGAVYSTAFSPDNRFLLSASEDKTVRLWSLDTYTALVSYKGHNHPVWDVTFSPFNHYFATASHDQTARLWSCDHIYPLRYFAGHLSDVDTVTFHPNGTYLVTGSSDKTCRMWDVAKGSCVRVFIGHTGAINTTAISPDGRVMASAGEDSLISLWDLGSGRRMKVMRGHGRTSIYSLSFSQDGSVLVSAGADCSVQVWDVKKGTGEAVAGTEPEPYNGHHQVSANSKTSNNKKEITPTPDHLATFWTKRTPVYKVQFTRRNLCLAAGAFMP